MHEKKIISSSKYQWLQMELSRFEEAGIIDSSQVQQILSSYEVKGKGSAGFIRILLILGSVLIGVGILSFIAGNWEALPRTVKFLLILFGLTGAYFTGWKLEDSYPKTSKSFYYIGAAIYGAGIFLVGQMFHSSSPYQQAFLVWALGTVPLALYLKDRWVMILSIVFIGIYASPAWDASVPYPFWVWVFIPLFYGCNERWLNRNRQVFFFANALLILTIWATFVRWEWHGGVNAFILLLLGAGMTFLNIRPYAEVLKQQGALIHGVAAIVLTYPDFWEMWGGVFHAPLLGYAVAVAYLAFLIFLLRKKQLSAVVISCALIFRFYLDLSIEFLPKSLYFLIGGILLILSGYWIEKSRKRGGGK
ncbi:MULTISPECIES: DUF2157 domain-containing protein [Thermoactinomyces]|uniref:DUF2157 domain-containing protein n=1 Tax=Thermoactinomyces TaxID=2023 RepID=UPI0011076C1F|nr:MULTISPECIES: DUF2157 domain-containing protein [Thermoactinomyces]MBH8584772.1 DUF2157 domain-containing protein [Thermoactinomyces sp. CICC 10520]QCV55526.1 DUF2157 domain-containing protein [Thermoactinomyces vulgaris]